MASTPSTHSRIPHRRTFFDHAQGPVVPTNGGYSITLDEANPFADVTLVYVAAGEPEDEGMRDREVDSSQLPEEPIIDGDGDRLSDEVELSLGLDPGNPDTDSDGFFDGDEWDFGTDPNDATSMP